MYDLNNNICLLSRSYIPMPLLWYLDVCWFGYRNITFMLNISSLAFMLLPFTYALYITFCGNYSYKSCFFSNPAFSLTFV